MNHIALYRCKDFNKPKGETWQLPHFENTEFQHNVYIPFHYNEMAPTTTSAWGYETGASNWASSPEAQKGKEMGMSP